MYCSVLAPVICAAPLASQAGGGTAPNAESAKRASYDPDELVAVEVHPRAATLRGRFTNPRTNYGSVLVWTNLSRW